MSEEFSLHPKLQADTTPVINLAINQVLLMNDERFPWLILVPRVNGLREWHDVPDTNECIFQAEIRQVSRVLQILTQAHKINVASLGNLVPQLHVHIIARFTNDAAWPDPVWGFAKPEPYADEAKMAFSDALRTALGAN